MKTENLEGAALEYWFNRAVCEDPDLLSIRCTECIDEHGRITRMFGWGEVGPVIHKEGIAITPHPRQPGVWAATQGAWKDEYDALGRTPLIAVMRCVVMDKFGTEVEGADC